ncbi:MAG TPA: hypothetical protein VKT77_17825 [Chthonomonadaceae bacterium]|nr:hypothetical protein [Chthonomonadaceae bacterium]
MKTITPQLPTVLGSFAAMLVAFLSLMSGGSPTSCMMKAGAAFMVFAGLGLILRFVLLEVAEDNAAKSAANQRAAQSNGLDMVVPGSTVADLLGSDEHDEDMTR